MTILTADTFSQPFFTYSYINILSSVYYRSPTEMTATNYVRNRWITWQGKGQQTVKGLARLPDELSFEIAVNFRCQANF